MANVLFTACTTRSGSDVTNQLCRHSLTATFHRLKRKAYWWTVNYDIVLSCMRILVKDAYTLMGCPYSYGMIRIFTEVLSYYKRLNLAHNSSIEVQTHRNCIILQNNKYFYRYSIC